MTPVYPSPGGFQSLRRGEFDHSPLMVFYEITRASDFASGTYPQTLPEDLDPGELTYEQGRLLIQQLTTFPRPPMLVFTGGDPFKRPDLPRLVQDAAGQGLKVAVAASQTASVTQGALADLKAMGLRRLCVSLEGGTAAMHDSLCSVSGGFERTLHVIRMAARLALPVQVNTTLTRLNVFEIDIIADLLAELGVTTWSVSFLVPQTERQADERISGEIIEGVFASLWAHSQHQPYAIKTHDAPHFRRFVWRDLETNEEEPTPARTAARYGSQIGTNDGKGVLYVSHTGEIFPSGLMPLACGMFPADSLVSVYQQHELFKALRDENRIGGKCGICHYRAMCGGSRARAFALTGDPLAAEPDCLGNFPECSQERDPCST